MIQASGLGPLETPDSRPVRARSVDTRPFARLLEMNDQLVRWPEISPFQAVRAVAVEDDLLVNLAVCTIDPSIGADLDVVSGARLVDVEDATLRFYLLCRSVQEYDLLFLILGLWQTVIEISIPSHVVLLGRLGFARGYVIWWTGDDGVN